MLSIWLDLAIKKPGNSCLSCMSQFLVSQKIHISLVCTLVCHMRALNHKLWLTWVGDGYKILKCSNQDALMLCVCLICFWDWNIGFLNINNINIGWYSSGIWQLLKWAKLVAGAQRMLYSWYPSDVRWRYFEEFPEEYLHLTKLRCQE